jgi:hypothetical protein
MAHPGYVERFKVELETPGVRVPLTADPKLWERAVRLGRIVLWAHTYGRTFAVPIVLRVMLPSRREIRDG